MKIAPACSSSCFRQISKSNRPKTEPAPAQDDPAEEEEEEEEDDDDDDE